MIDRRTFVTAVAAMAAIAAAVPARAAGEPIRIGEMNSYTRLPAFTLPYRSGWELALEEINAAGGVLGRQIEVISKDDGGEPGTAVTMANDLLAREKVSLIFGALLSNVGLALADFAKQKQIPFIAAEPLTDTIAWSQGNAYTFRLRPGTYVQAAMLAEEAAKLPARRWAVVAPNYEYGKSAVEAFKALLSARRPDVEWVGEQWPALFKIDAGATVQALARTNPEAIYNVTFGADLIKFVREGKLRGLFEGRTVASILGGEPDWIDPLKDEAPEGWIVTGYPWYALETPEHVTFREAYRKRFNDYPRLGSVVGYAAMKTIAAAIAKAGSTEPKAITAALRGLTLESPLGPITYRAADQQSTMGTFVGRLTVKDGMPRMVDWRYGDGAKYLPSEVEAAKMRPAE
ncbi:ABC transporter substrate-binding protein [Shumkonia mesophila]|uniref:ABC transporter substrate-binding protein n=1 Tax=Shumkonia mesophila TaxID=2838854 RepID=UPI00293500AB|nr:ABC transporter substrate-binding protein [Shumkonia mesophila]